MIVFPKNILNRQPIAKYGPNAIASLPFFFFTINIIAATIPPTIKAKKILNIVALKPKNNPATAAISGSLTLHFF